MIRFVQFTVILCFIGCENKSNQNVQKVEISCEDKGYINVQEWRKESLFIDSVTFNGENFLLNTISYYRKIFGREIDKYEIASEAIGIHGNIGEKKIRYIFKGAIVDQVGNKSIINTLDFTESNVHLDTNGIRIMGGTKVEVICEIFPRSCRLIPSNGNLWSGFIELRVSNSGLDFRRVFLIFQNEKLRKLKIVNLGL
jgi:hypothetical protein